MLDIRSFITEKWRTLLIPFAAIAVISAVLFFPREPSDSFSEEHGSPLFEPFEPAEPEDEIIPEAELAAETVPSPILVDVKGAVKFPGMYSLKEDDRLLDAVNAAGGYTEAADTRLLNHAQKLYDEAVIYVPVSGEEPPLYEQPAALASSGDGVDGLVNINTADLQGLQALPGIGPSKAAAILQYREENGVFTEPAGLKNVSGIGDKTFEKLEAHITLK